MTNGPKVKLVIVATGNPSLKLGKIIIWDGRICRCTRALVAQPFILVTSSNL
ncbi:MAG: hypothetical protein ACQZ3M_06220 [cyanobacterium endosymbiont of Rhopalodia fuxianensis]